MAGLTRPSTLGSSAKKDVDARDRRGHDVERSASRYYSGFMNPAVATQTQTTRKGGKDAAGRPALLLDWYDRHRRVLPWAAAGGGARGPVPGLAVGNHAAAAGVKTVGPYF